MSTIVVKAANGTFNVPAAVSARGGGIAGHQLHVEATPGVAGDLTLLAKSPGSSVFEPVPDGTFSLDTPKTILFTFICDAYQLVMTGVTGTGNVVITDLTAEV